jgi:pyochelin synthetase
VIDRRASRISDLGMAQAARREPATPQVAATRSPSGARSDKLTIVPIASRAYDPQVCFVFSGQGGQWMGMGRVLLDSLPLFRAAIEECDRAVRRYSDVSVVDELQHEKDDAVLPSIEVIQLSNFAVQVALGRLWQHLGVQPVVVVGHSLGEITAAHFAGVLSLESAARIVCCRGRLLSRLAGKGLMAHIELPSREVENALAPYEGKVTIAAQNDPSSCVLSGEPDAIRQLAAALAARDVFTRLVNVNVAYHSAQVDACRGEFYESLRGLAYSHPRIPIISSVTGREAAAADFNVEHFWHNMRQPVRFAAATECLLQRGVRVFMEVGPHPILLASIERSCARQGVTATTLASMRRDDVQRTLSDTLAALQTLGQEVASDHVLAAATENEQRDVIVRDLRRKLARMLGRASSHFDLEVPLTANGMDSLQAVRLAEEIRASFAASLGASEILAASSLGDLADRVIKKAEMAGAADALPDLASLSSPLDRSGQAPFPLLDLQQAYWYGTQADEGSSRGLHLYFERDARDLDLSRFTRAWQRLIERHSMLRSFINSEGSWQVLEPAPPCQIEIADLGGLPVSERAARLASTRLRMAAESPDPGAWPLFEIRANILDGRLTRIHVAMSLLVCDYMSWGILEREWQRLYDDPAAELPPLGIGVADYVRGLSRLREHELCRRSLEYWQERLPAFPFGPQLPFQRTPPPPRWHHGVVRIPAETWTALKSRASAVGVTPSLLLCGVYAEVMTRFSKNPHFALNVLTQNRHLIHPQVQDLVGRFNSTLLLEVDNRTEASFTDRLRALQRRFLADFDHRFVGGVQLTRELGRLHGSAPRALFPVVFASTLGSGAKASAPLLWLGDLRYRCLKTPQVVLDNQVYEEGGGLVSYWDCLESHLLPGVCRDMIGACELLLTRLAGDSSAWQAAAPLAARRSEQTTRIELLPGAADTCLHNRFEQQAAARPAATAVIAGGRTLSYQELDQRACALAAELRRRGARPNTLVGVVMRRGWEQIVATLAILKAGAAYLPIDTHLVPPERARTLLDLGEARLALTQAGYDPSAPWARDVGVLVVEDSFVPVVGAAAAERAQVSDLAYVIYTSGSTGTPKGVMIDHAGAVNTILDVNARHGIGPQDSVLALSSLGFDLSVWDIFGILGAGGCIVMPDSTAQMEPEIWLQLLARHRVTVWNTVPKLMEMLVEHVTSKQACLPDSLRLVMMSGDWIPVALPDRIRKVSASAELISMGGATEASIWSIDYRIGRVDPSWPSIPYGKAMANQSVRVLDERFHERETWVTGELFIGGIGVAKGYWRDAERTAQRFVRHPRTQEILYRTGDLGRYLPSGDIEFLGREDTQVKVRGYRIELGEIERALGRHPQVRETYLLLRDAEDQGTQRGGAFEVGAARRGPGDKQIVAYVVPQAGARPTAEELRTFLRKGLPDYMLPAFIVFLDEIPLSPNGKVDRKRLPLPTWVAAERAPGSPPDVPADGAADPVEQELIAIWKTLLGITGSIDTGKSFFELGGDSVMVVRCLSRIRQQFAVDLSTSVFFATNAATATVKGLAALIRSSQGRGPAQSRSLVAIKSAGTRPPLFLVHPVGGGVLCYAGLSACLGPDQPLYGLQAAGLDAPAPEREDLPAMAARYLDEIETVQPRGPCFLGGWSLGGTVAFEMAQQLRRQGRQIGLLLLIDSFAPNQLSQPTAPDLQRLLTWFVRELRGRQDLALVETAPLQAENLEERFDALIGQGVLPADIGIERLRSLFTVYCDNALAGRSYVPAARYPGDLVLLCASLRPPTEFRIHPALRDPPIADPHLGWIAWTAGRVERHTVPGDHYSLFSAEGIGAVGQRIAALLAAAQLQPGDR